MTCVTSHHIWLYVNITVEIMAMSLLMIGWVEFKQSFLIEMRCISCMIKAVAKVAKDTWEDIAGFVGDAPCCRHGIIVEIIPDWCKLVFGVYFRVCHLERLKLSISLKYYDSTKVHK